MSKFQWIKTKWRNAFDFRDYSTVEGNESYPNSSALNPEVASNPSGFVEYMLKDNEVINSYYSNSVYVPTTYSSSWEAQQWLDEYGYNNYKNFLSIPHSDKVYFLMKDRIQQIYINNTILKIDFKSELSIELEYETNKLANYQYKYINSCLSESELNLESDDWLHIYNGESIVNIVQDNPNGKYYIHSGKYVETSLTCVGNLQFYFEDETDIHIQFHVNQLTSSNIQVFGFGTFSWTGESALINNLGTSLIVFHCKDINIDSIGENNPVIFSSINTNSSCDLFFKGREVNFSNEQYTFIDFDAISDFRIDIDFSIIRLAKSGLFYGFYQTEADYNAIWRNAYIYNTDETVVFDYSSSYFRSYHTLVNIRINNIVSPGNIFSYSGEELNIFLLQLYSCWFNCFSTVFDSVVYPIPDSITFNNQCYSNQDLQPNPSKFTGFINESNVNIDNGNVISAYNPYALAEYYKITNGTLEDSLGNNYTYDSSYSAAVTMRDILRTGNNYKIFQTISTNTSIYYIKVDALWCSPTTSSNVLKIDLLNHRLSLTLSSSALAFAFALDINSCRHGYLLNPNYCKYIANSYSQLIACISSATAGDCIRVSSSFVCPSPIILKDNVNLYFDEVILQCDMDYSMFTDNNIECNCSILGNGSFKFLKESTNHNILRLENSNSNIYFECKEVYYAGDFANFYSSSDGAATGGSYQVKGKNAISKTRLFDSDGIQPNLSLDFINFTNVLSAVGRDFMYPATTESQTILIKNLFANTTNSDIGSYEFLGELSTKIYFIGCFLKTNGTFNANGVIEVNCHYSYFDNNSGYFVESAEPSTVVNGYIMKSNTSNEPGFTVNNFTVDPSFNLNSLT